MARRREPKELVAAPGHTTSCHVDNDGDQCCVCWCETGGMLIHLQRCVEVLEGLYLVADHPAREVRTAARVALEKWRRP